VYYPDISVALMLTRRVITQLLASDTGIILVYARWVGICIAIERVEYKSRQGDLFSTPVGWSKKPGVSEHSK